MSLQWISFETTDGACKSRGSPVSKVYRKMKPTLEALATGQSLADRGSRVLRDSESNFANVSLNSEWT